MHNKNVVSNHSEEIIAKENKKLREDSITKDEKLDALFNFLINMQHSVMNRTSSITVLQNYDIITLRSKINEIQEEVLEILHRNFRPLINDNLNNFNGTMKSSSSNMYSMRNFREISEENEKIKLYIILLINFLNF